MKGEKSFMNNFTMNLIIALSSILVLLALLAINITLINIIVISIIVLVLIGNELKENSGRQMSYGTARKIYGGSIA